MQAQGHKVATIPVTLMRTLTEKQWLWVRFSF
jgi:hypothetical protein